MSNDAEKLVMRVVRPMDNPKLQDLARELRAKGLSSNDATKTVFTLWKESALVLLEPSPPPTLFRYIIGLQSFGFWVITVLVVSMIPTVFYVVDPPLLYLRYVLGLLFVFYLPGAMLIEALNTKNRDPEGLGRLALGIGLSLALIPLIGLFLNYTPWGIRLTTIAISLAAFTEAMAVTALVRKYQYYALTRSR